MFFPVTFSFILLPKVMTTILKIMPTSSMTLLLHLHWTACICSSSLTVVSRIMQSHPLLIFMSVIDPSSKQFIIQLILPQLKLNSSPLGMVSIRLLTYQEFQKLLLSLTLSMLLRRSLILLSTLSKCIQLLSLKSLGSSSAPTITTLLYFGNIPLTATSLYSYPLTETLNDIDKFQYSHASHLRTLARKAKCDNLI